MHVCRESILKWLYIFNPNNTICPWHIMPLPTLVLSLGGCTTSRMDKTCKLFIKLN
uniref:Uncharacterized protein n=1 Tax=Aegilops tauschii subsp. strangulata TaxID=200361 RepID=A0A453QMT2_AEGTS